MAFKDFLNLFKASDNGTTKQSSDTSVDQQQLTNFLAERNLSKDKIQKVLFDLVEQTKALIQQDITKWRQAWQMAISVEFPNRIPLYGVYRDVGIDNHLLGLIGQIKNEVLQKVVKVIDRDSKDELPELTRHLEDAQWFIDFCGYVVDSVFNGYELVQFGDIIEVNGIKKFECVENVCREHVIPEYHVFTKIMGEGRTNGIDYTQPPYDAWCIGIGKPKDLGLFNNVARHAISKKNIEAFWDKFGQIFGMPIRIGKTSSSNKTDRDNVAEMLKNMGSAAWGVFPDGTEIEIKETTRGDAWQVYDKRIERANSEMSKAIVNQTMTIDNGSSHSQSKTHLQVQENVIAYFATLVRIVCNDKLIPLMMKHGFTGWENARIIFDETVELTPEQQQKVEEMILKEYDVDPDYFIGKYNIKITGKKLQPVPPTNGFF